MPIHATAVIEKGAEIDSTAEIGPFCCIGPHAKIGAQTRLIAHVMVLHRTTLGARNVVHPFAVLGGAPQDLKYRDEPSHLLIGDDNTIRESVTINIGTAQGTMETRIGSHCLIMAYSHVAHDCVLEDRVILANGATLAGHVSLEQSVILGGLSAVHQYCRIGRYAFVGGGSMIAQDTPPFCIAQGDRAQLVSINTVGLHRAGFTRSTIRHIHKAFSRLFWSKESRAEVLLDVEANLAPQCEEVLEICQFIRSAKRGVIAGRIKDIDHDQHNDYLNDNNAS